MPGDKRGGFKPGNVFGSRRLGGRATSRLMSQLTIDELDEYSYRTLIWSLSWLSMFTVTQSLSNSMKDPFKAQRMTWDKLIKQYGFDKVEKILTIRMDACKLLNNILAKKKMKQPKATTGKQVEELQKQIEQCNNLADATEVLRQKTDEGLLSQREAKQIMRELRKEEKEEEVIEEEIEDDPLADLMDETMDEAKMAAEEDEDNGSV